MDSGYRGGSPLWLVPSRRRHRLTPMRCLPGITEPSQIASTRKQAFKLPPFMRMRLFLRNSLPFRAGIVAVRVPRHRQPGGAGGFRQEDPVKRRSKDLGINGASRCSSAACGTDILFLETMAERGGEPSFSSLPRRNSSNKRQESGRQLGGPV